jgi:signal transduction histidine kinase
LAAALAWLCRAHRERMGIPCVVRREGENEELPEDLRSMAYQCVRELLTNVNKHGQASRVEVTLNFVDRFLTILVEDDGVGFDVRTLDRSEGVDDTTGGFGLFSIRERLRSVDGRMLVDSQPGQGTRVFLSFPIPAGYGSVSEERQFPLPDRGRLDG